MSRSNQPDLFGHENPQGDLFGGASAKPQVYVPNPQNVRNRLEDLIGQIREAETMPWDATQRNLYSTIVIPYLVKLLSIEEGEQYRLQFEQEWERLMAA